MQVYIGIKKNKHVKVVLFLLFHVKIFQFHLPYNKCHILFKIECSLGYRGSNCSEACTFPHFGKECQEKCNCSPRLYNHITGCFGMLNAFITEQFQKIALNIDSCIPVIPENFMLNSKTVPASYDIASYQIESSSSRSVDSSSVKTFPNVIVYTAITFVIAFVVFFDLFSGTYFYKHCIKQTSISDGKQINNQQERYNILLQSSHIERENNTDTAYLEPISDVYEEIESCAETVN